MLQRKTDDTDQGEREIAAKDLRIEERSAVIMV
jgi:hypothetical protein